MGLISRVKRAVNSLKTGRKDGTMQKISPRHFVEAIPTTIKGKVRKRVRKVFDNWNEYRYSHQSNLIESDTSSSLFGTEALEDVEYNIESAQAMFEGDSQLSGHYQPSTVTKSIKAIDNSIIIDDSENLNESETSSVIINDASPFPETSWFRGSNRNSTKPDTVQDIEKKSTTMETVVDEDRNLSTLRLSRFDNIALRTDLETRQYDLVAKCLDQSAAEGEWITIAEGQHGQNYAARYLPTIIHENKKMLDKFLRAFRDQSGNDEIYRALRLAEIAFDSLDQHLKEAGLMDCVVEFLKPANHPNRILEELQRARSEILGLQIKYRELQDKLNAPGEKGVVTNIWDKTGGSIPASELVALKEDRDKWYKQFHVIYTTMKERSESLDYDIQAFEAIQEPHLIYTEHLSSQNYRLRLERQLEEQKAKYETLKFIKESDETKHAAKIASYQARLLESEAISHLTPEQLGEKALVNARCEAEEFKRLYVESCLTIAELENELAIAQQCGLELGVIAEQAERLHEMRLPKTVCSPSAQSNAASAERAEEEDIDRSRFTDDSEIF